MAWRWLVRAGIAAMALGLPVLSHGQGRPVVKGGAVFVMPRDFDTAIACDGRFGFRGDPVFGDGLIARYVFAGSFAVHPSNRPIASVAPAGVSYEEDPAASRPTVIATDPFVIRTHDDLIARYHAVCEGGELADLRLSDIDYRRATPSQRRASPPVAVPTGGMAPVSIGRRDPGFLPEPVAGGTISFDTWPAQYSGPNWLSITPDFGSGLNSAYLIEGREDPSYYPWFAAKLTRDGFIVASADLDGKSALIILDPRKLTARDMMLARANMIRELEFSRTLKLERIVYYPAARGGIDDLRLPQAIRADLRWQIDAAAEANRKNLAELAHAMPEESQLEEMIDREWRHFADEPGAPGWDGELATSGATFGEIHDYACARTGEIFTCTLGVTYLEDGRPKYRQREIQVTRDAAHAYRLTHYAEDVVLVN
ncbi:MAG: hypothetical protein JWN66_3750 [Sphingomonas bacterium]|nr:hypothetical protein [Sphingomonas bacterium]